MIKKIIHAEQAPRAIGPYSQAIRAGNTVYLSGQIGLCAETQHMPADLVGQANQVFQNLKYVAQAAGGDLSDIVKVTLYLTDMADFSEINQVMEEFFNPPFPARATIAVKALPKNALVEAEAIMILPENS